MKTRIFTLLIVLLCLPIVSWGQDESERPDGLIGAGTKESPFELDSKEDLVWFQTQIDKQHQDYCAILTADIDLNPGFTFNTDGTYEPSNETPYQWTPIANYILVSGELKNGYEGIFDGKGHTISGLYINKKGYSNKALFAGINDDGIVQNLGIINSFINGGSFVGAVCGTNDGTIKNCYNTSIVISNDENANIMGGAFVGGICGYNESGTIENCYNTGFLQSVGDGIGGICGVNQEGIVRNCYNTSNITAIGGESDRAGKSEGDYIGGICGSNGGTIENCFNIGEPSSGNGGTNVGGVCGDSNDKISGNGYLEGVADKGIGNETEPTEGAKSMTPQELVEAMNNALTLEGGWKSNASYNETTKEFLFPTFQEREEQPEQPEEPGDDDNDDKEPSTPVIPDYPDYYNIYIDTCQGVWLERSTKVVREGNSVRIKVEIEEGTDTTNLELKFKRGLFGYWEDLTRYKTENPDEYIIKNIYTDIYVMAEGAMPTGIEEITGVKVYTHQGSLFVYTPKQEQVIVVSMNGTIMKQETQVGLRQYSGLHQGIYIISVGKERFKVKL